MFIALSVGAAVAFTFYAEWAGDSSPLRYALLVLSVGFLAPALRPLNWKPRAYFVVTEKGVQFFDVHHGQPTVGIAWDRVVDVRFEQLLGNTRGVVIEMRLDDETIDKHFKDSKMTQRILGYPEGPTFKIAFSNAFQNSPLVIRSILDCRPA